MLSFTTDKHSRTKAKGNIITGVVYSRKIKGYLLPAEVTANAGTPKRKAALCRSI
jgi:hypothetical protein